MHFNLYKLVWYLIHLLFTIFQTVCNTYEGIKSSLVYLFPNYRSTTSVLKEICKSVGQLRKVPAHITVLLGNEEPSYKDLARLVLWSIASGVSFISFYDNEGKLKKQENELRHEIDKVLPHDNWIIWHSDANGYKNGFVGKKIHLKVYSIDDGQKGIAKVCKKLLHSDEINDSVLDSLLRKQYEFPDPHMAVYPGNYLNLRGYPPWQTRLTEFFSIGSYHNITHEQFLRVLRCYNMCEQRVGK